MCTREDRKQARTKMKSDYKKLLCDMGVSHASLQELAKRAVAEVKRTDGLAGVKKYYGATKSLNTPLAELQKLETSNGLMMETLVIVDALNLDPAFAGLSVRGEAKSRAAKAAGLLQTLFAMEAAKMSYWQSPWVFVVTAVHIFGCAMRVMKKHCRKDKVDPSDVTKETLAIWYSTVSQYCFDPTKKDDPAKGLVAKTMTALKNSVGEAGMGYRALGRAKTPFSLTKDRLKKMSAEQQRRDSLLYETKAVDLPDTDADMSKAELETLMRQVELLVASAKAEVGPRDAKTTLPHTVGMEELIKGQDATYGDFAEDDSAEYPFKCIDQGCEEFDEQLDDYLTRAGIGQTTASVLVKLDLAFEYGCSSMRKAKSWAMEAHKDLGPKFASPYQLISTELSPQMVDQAIESARALAIRRSLIAA